MSNITLVKLYGKFVDMTNTPIAGEPVFIRLRPVPQTIEDRTIIKDLYSIITDEEGYFEVELIGGINVVVSMPRASFQVSGVLPFMGTLDVVELGRQP